MKTKIIVIIGPTAVGKTELSLTLAKKYSGEIINGDSMQVYKHLDIGTAKATQIQQQAIPHHLIDIKSVRERYDASEFTDLASDKIKQIEERGKLPIVVGGTGLYIEGLLYGFQFGKNNSDDKFRKLKYQQAEQYGRYFIWEELKKIDPKAADNIHPNNLKRVVRALEVSKFSDHLFSEQNQTIKNRKSNYDPYVITLYTDRSLLYERINQRVDQMLNKGLLDEAKWLYQQQLDSSSQALTAIGYKEFFPYLESKKTFDECVRQLKTSSRRYAKRQLTWFKNRMPESHWYDLIVKNEKDILVNDLNKFLKWAD